METKGTKTKEKQNRKDTDVSIKVSLDCQSASRPRHFPRNNKNNKALRRAFDRSTSDRKARITLPFTSKPVAEAVEITRQ